MAQLSDADYRLSMIIGRRKRDREAESRLSTRTLLVHRLRDGAKAVLRLPMSRNIETSREFGIYCEPCNLWFNTEGGGEQFNCPKCERVFVLEFAVYTEVTP